MSIKKDESNRLKIKKYIVDSTIKYVKSALFDSLKPFVTKKEYNPTYVVGLVFSTFKNNVDIVKAKISQSTDKKLLPYISFVLKCLDSFVEVCDADLLDPGYELNLLKFYNDFNSKNVESGYTYFNYFFGNLFDEEYTPYLEVINDDLFSESGKKGLIKYNYTLLENGTYEISLLKLKVKAVVYLPSTYEGISITKIKDDGFKECQNLIRVKIPSTYTEIGNGSFSYCKNLTSVIFSDKLTRIGSSSFKNCISLKEINLPNSLTVMGSYAFTNCKSAKTLTIGNKIHILRTSCFEDCSSLEKVIIPDNVEKVEESCFCDCKSLKEIRLSIKLTRLEDYVLSDCCNLKVIEQLDGITYIGCSALSNCFLLENIILPPTLNEISTNAFSYCLSLKKIVIPSNVQIMGKHVFVDTDAFKIEANKISGVFERSINKAILSDDRLEIYCEARSLKKQWNYEWNYFNCHVFYREDWKKVKGIPYSKDVIAKMENEK